MSVFSRVKPKAAPPRAVVVNRPTRSGLRALVPTAYRADGETNEYLRTYKMKWLSKIDFASESHVESLLLLSYMVLALGRESEAEFVADTLIRHVDLKRVNDGTKSAIVSALYLSAWLKTKHGKDARALVARAKELGRSFVQRDREWLSEEAAGEIQDALERKKLGYLAGPFAGIVCWLNDAGARVKAEAVLATALDATRALMR